MYKGPERRKSRIGDNNFEPNTPFEGYVFAKLESLAQRLNALPCDDQSKRLGKCENEISNIKGKATMFGLIAGTVSAFITKYFFEK